MSTILANLWSFFDLLLVVLGFSLIIVIHELGHFLAARWAGVRVLAFAVGFGPALFSYRKGLSGGGLRRGSSEAEFRKLATQGKHPPRGTDPGHVDGVSPTEYRLNILPFGGYVKMLGQDDADPGAQSREPDSYTSAPVWKRMVIISAGVVMNVITAAALFMIVYSVGLQTEPPKIGSVVPGSPAAMVVPDNAKNLGITDIGLLPGDRVVSVNGESMNTFNDVVLSTAMSNKDQPLDMQIERPQVGLLRFRIKPESSTVTDGLLSIGIMPPVSNQVVSPPRQAGIADIQDRLKRLGFPGVEPGMTLTAVGEGLGRKTVQSFADLEHAAKTSDGKAFPATFTKADGTPVEVKMTPLAEIQTATFELSATETTAVPHLLGLIPALPFESIMPGGGAEAAGVQPGDIVARIGDVRWPTYAECTRVIRSRAGETVSLVVARQPKDADAPAALVDLGQVQVSSAGTIGVYFSWNGGELPYITSWPRWKHEKAKEGGAFNAETAGVASGKELPILPGSRVIGIGAAGVDGGAIAPVRTMTELRTVLREHVGEEGGTVTLQVQLPPMAGAAEVDGPLVETITWAVPAEDAKALHALSWQPPIGLMFFESEKFLDRASNPIAAVGKGLHETKRVMLTTYITFARLWQGSVQVKHLRGPVGIAHTGAIFAEKGMIWLLFFMALVSINLAVINFLPIPIADGGHMVFLIYEQLTGKPPSPAVMNIAAVAGLVLLGGVFLLVTIQDIARLFG